MKMKDTEGSPLPQMQYIEGAPLEEDGYDFDINLWGDGHLSMSIGSNVLTVELRDILQEYLEDHKRLDGGRCLASLSDLLDEYANKYKAADSGCCELCKHWNSIEHEKSDTHGQCRRYPPTTKPPDDATWIEWGWPITDCSNLCGEFSGYDS